MIAFIYTFPNGTKLDLLKVNAIGALDQDELYRICIPVLFHGSNKYSLFVVGSGMGKIEQHHKDNMLKTWNELQTAWEQAKMAYYELQAKNGQDSESSTEHGAQQKAAG